MLVAHLNRWNGRQYLLRWSPCFGFFVCHSRRTHYPTLEKRGAQNVAVCESQGEQRELNDHWKSIKRFRKKIIGDDAKKDKKIDWNTSFNKTGVEITTGHRSWPENLNHNCKMTGCLFLKVYYNVRPLSHEKQKILSCLSLYLYW